MKKYSIDIKTTDPKFYNEEDQINHYFNLIPQVLSNIWFINTHPNYTSSTMCVFKSINQIVFDQTYPYEISYTLYMTQNEFENIITLAKMYKHNFNPKDFFSIKELIYV